MNSLIIKVREDWINHLATDELCLNVKLTTFTGNPDDDVIDVKGQVIHSWDDDDGTPLESVGEGCVVYFEEFPLSLAEFHEHNDHFRHVKSGILYEHEDGNVYVWDEDAEWYWKGSMPDFLDEVDCFTRIYEGNLPPSSTVKENKGNADMAWANRITDLFDGQAFDNMDWWHGEIRRYAPLGIREITNQIDCLTGEMKTSLGRIISEKIDEFLEA